MTHRRSIRESNHLPVLATLCVMSSLAACATTERDPLAQPAVAARLSVADGTVHYRNLDAEELEPWGPSALRMAQDESFWIVDAAGDQLVHLSASGQLVARLPLAEHVTGAMDVLVREHDLFVLDTVANTPSVVRLDREGRFLGELKLSSELESSVDGFFDTHDGRVLLQVDGVEGCEVQVHDEQLSACAQPESLTVAGHAIRVSTPDAPGDQSLGHELVIRVGDVSTNVHTEHFVSSVRVLRTTDDGELYVSMEEVSFAPIVLVDATLLHIDARGTVVERARLPVAEQLVFVRHPVAIDTSGRVFGLFTHRAGADITELPLLPVLEPVLPARIAEARARFVAKAQPAQASSTPIMAIGSLPGEVGVTSAALTACRTTAQMEAEGFGYVNSATWLSPTNLDRANTKCVGRSMPSYIETAAASSSSNATAVCTGSSPGIGYECVRSVPYDWGGVDSLATYRSQMLNGKQAGDPDSKLASSARTIESCSRGLDCSGFISRAWDLANLGVPKITRTTTTGLSAYSNPLTGGTLGLPMDPSATLRVGDILLRTGTHVAMFRKYGTPPNGTTKLPYMLEATTKTNYDRVIYRQWPYSRCDAYEPRRFKGVCP